jgi:hypothetical protein
MTISREERTNGRAGPEGESLETQCCCIGPGRWSYSFALSGRALREGDRLEMQLSGGGWVAVRCVTSDKSCARTRSPLVQFALDVATEEGPASTYLFPPEEALFRWPSPSTE